MNYPGHGAYCNQTENLTAECAEGARRGNNWLNTSSVPPRPPRLFFLARKYMIAIGRPISIPEWL